MNNRPTYDDLGLTWYRDFAISVELHAVDERYRYLIYSNGRRVADDLHGHGYEYYEQSFNEAKLCVDKLIEKHNKQKQKWGLK